MGHPSVPAGTPRGSSAVAAARFEAYTKNKKSCETLTLLTVLIRVVDQPSFFADPNPTIFSHCVSGSSCFLNADPDPALKTE